MKGMIRPLCMHKGGFVLIIPLGILDSGAEHDVEALAVTGVRRVGSSCRLGIWGHRQPMSSGNRLHLIYDVCIPFPYQEGVCDGCGEDEQGHTSRGIEDGQFRVVGDCPLQMHQRDFRSAFDEGTGRRLGELPLAIVRPASEISKLQLLAIGSDAGNGPNP